MHLKCARPDQARQVFVAYLLSAATSSLRNGRERRGKTLPFLRELVEILDFQVLVLF